MKRLACLAILLCSCGLQGTVNPPVTGGPPITSPVPDTTRPTIIAARIIDGPVISLPPLLTYDRMVPVSGVESSPTLEVTFSEPVNIRNGMGLRVYEQRLNSTELEFDHVVSADRRTVRMTTRTVMPLGVPPNLVQVYSFDTRIADDAGLSLDRNTRFTLTTREAHAEDIQLTLVSKRRLTGTRDEEVTYQNTTSAPIDIASLMMALEDRTGMGDLGTAQKDVILIDRVIPVGAEFSITRPIYDGIVYRQSVIAFWGVSAANQLITVDRF